MRTAALLTKRGTQYFKLSFPLDEREISRKLRILNAKKKAFNTWELDFTEDAVDFLLDNGFTFNGAFHKLKRKEYEKKNPIKKIPKYKKRKLKLRKYQIEGLNHCEYYNGRALLADEMGLGKTIQALAWIQYRKDLNKILIVCPSSLKDNWEEEIRIWLTRKLSVEILDGQTPYSVRKDIVIINYDILSYWVDELRIAEFDVCIADEIHYAKNDKSQRSIAFSAITKNIPNIIGLTGTPIENDPMEIYYIVNLINKNIFPNYYKFIQKYCGAKQVKQKVRGKIVNGKYVPQTRTVWKKQGVTNSKELHRILTSTIMIRRLKKDVETELPPKQYATVKFHLENKDKYKQAEDDFIQYLKDNFDDKVKRDLQLQLGQFMDKYDIQSIDFQNHILSSKDIKKAKKKKLDAVAKAPALAKIQELKILAAEGKINQTIDWIDNFLESGEKLIVFGINKVIISALKNHYKDAVFIDGSTTKPKRKEARIKFQTDPNCKLFIGNIKAAGVGLTLTASSNVAIIQFPWNPGEMLQAEDRSHRITQKRKVTIWKLVAKDTIEERIIKLLQYKQNEIDKIIDGKDIKHQEKLVNLLIESYQKEAV